MSDNEASSSGEGFVGSNPKTMSNDYFNSIMPDGHLSISGWTSSNQNSKRQSQESVKDTRGSRNSVRLNSDKAGHSRKVS